MDKNSEVLFTVKLMVHVHNYKWPASNSNESGSIRFSSYLWHQQQKHICETTHCIKTDEMDKLGANIRTPCWLMTTVLRACADVKKKPDLSH